MEIKFVFIAKNRPLDPSSDTYLYTNINRCYIDHMKYGMRIIGKLCHIFISYDAHAILHICRHEAIEVAVLFPKSLVLVTFLKVQFYIIIIVFIQTPDNDYSYNRVYIKCKVLML